MKPVLFPQSRGPRSRSGFSLVEVTLAMGIAAVALVSILGMLPQAMKYGRDGADQTAIGAVLEDVHDRLKGSELRKGEVMESPFFYDPQGRFLSWEEALAGKGFFRVEVLLEEPAEEGPDAGFPEGMLVAVLELYWPLDPAGEPVRSGRPRTTVTYPVTALTGLRWEEIDSRYHPRVEY